MELKFEIYGKIRRPVEDVFDAVYQPGRLSKYFATGGASGPLVEGTTVFWRFADFPGEHPVAVKKVIRSQLIVMEWAAQEGGYSTRTEIQFESLDAGNTMVKIAESGWREGEVGLKSSYGNCMGWSQMIAFLKGYLEYGINLREGFY